MAPGMALMFLMFATTLGGRSLLLERSQGTLPAAAGLPDDLGPGAGRQDHRHLPDRRDTDADPDRRQRPHLRVALGRPTGRAGAGAGRRRWPLPAGACSSPRSPARPARSPPSARRSCCSSASWAARSSTPRAMPAWFQALSHITPNAWGLDGFTTLALGGSLARHPAAHCGAAPDGRWSLFGVALAILRRKGLAQP